MNCVKDVKGTSLFSILNQSLAHAQKKIEVVSDNVARALLPNEKAKVLKENSFRIEASWVTALRGHLSRQMLII